MNIICICFEVQALPGVTLRAYWIERKELLLGEQLLEKLPHLALRVSTSGIAHLGDDR
jgi:hypothetical protein